MTNPSDHRYVSDPYRRISADGQLKAAASGKYGVMGLSIMLGYRSQRITLRTYVALVLCITILVGFALTWLYLVPLS